MALDSLAKTTTLFDSNGNPLTVELREGRYELSIRDLEIQQILANILADGIPHQPVGTQTVEGSVRTEPGVAPLIATYPDFTAPSVVLSQLNASAQVNLAGHGTTIFNLTGGTGTLNVVFEVSADSGITWDTTPAFVYFVGSLLSVAATGITNPASARVIVPTAGFNAARCRISTYSSGSVSAQARATGAPPPIIFGALPSGGNTLGTVLTTPNWAACAAPLAVTNTGTVGNAVTATLPAVAANFHYITEIQIVKFSAGLLTAGSTPVLVTTTNLPGSLVFSFDAAADAGGTAIVQQFEPQMPLKSSVINTATTIVCPATTSLIWRVNVFYRADI